MRGLAEALRSELASDGIGVSVVFPPARPCLSFTRSAAGVKVLPADQVAQAVLRGIRKKHFVIAPGWEMATLARMHSLLGSLLQRFWFDRLVGDCRQQDEEQGVSGITCKSSQYDGIS